jgi:high-affinity iron transporter
MFSSFLITFREGLEAFLLVGIMLAYLTKLGARQYHRYIYAGAVGGVLGSVVVAALFQIVIDQFSNEYYRQLLMIGILLFAACVLTYMAIWMQKQSKAHASDVQRELEYHVTTGNLVGMVALAAVAVLREGFETVLFFSALGYSGDPTLTLQSGITGGLLGLVASIVLVAAFMRGARNLSIQPFFKYTGILIIVIAGGFVASSVNMLQAIDWLPVLVASVFDISFILDDERGLGIFLRALFGYNASPTLLQFCSWILYLGVFGASWWRSYAPKA